jgi:hypothetical protein
MIRKDSGDIWNLKFNQFSGKEKPIQTTSMLSTKSGNHCGKDCANFKQLPMKSDITKRLSDKMNKFLNKEKQTQ